MEIVLLVAFSVLAILLYRSTALYPEYVQGSTANYVRFLALGLGILCSFEVFGWLRDRETDEKKKLAFARAPVKFWGLVALLVVYSLLLEPLGFYIASVLFLPVAMVTQGARKPVPIAIAVCGVILFVYLVFDTLLGVPLPERMLFG